MIPLDVVSGGFDMVCNGRRVVIFNEGLEVFSFSIRKSSFCFTDVEVIAVPATGFVNYFRFLRTIVTVTFENVCWLAYETSSLYKNA